MAQNASFTVQNIIYNSAQMKYTINRKVHGHLHKSPANKVRKSGILCNGQIGKKRIGRPVRFFTGDPCGIGGQSRRFSF